MTRAIDPAGAEQSQLEEPDEIKFADRVADEQREENTDPDEIQQDDNEVQADVSFDGATDWGVANPFADNAYELIVVDGRCSFTSLATYSRFHAYKALAEWLTKERGSFLKSCDLLDLGPATASELLEQGCSVVQKDLLRMLKLDDDVSYDSFCRSLDLGELVWRDGVAPIRMLFSHAAKLAYVARAVPCHANELGQPLTEEILNKYADIQGPKGKMEKPSAQCDVPTFIKYANNIAGTAWKDVLKVHSYRMLRPQGNDQSGNSASTVPPCS